MRDFADDCSRGDKYILVFLLCLIYNDTKRLHSMQQVSYNVSVQVAATAPPTDPQRDDVTDAGIASFASFHVWHSRIEEFFFPCAYHAIVPLCR